MRSSHGQLSAAIALGTLLWGAAACSDSSGPERSGTETGSLGLSCAMDAECGPLSCVTGVCSRSCDADMACADLGGMVQCSNSAICLDVCMQDRDCGDSRLVCQSGSCVDATAGQCTTNNDCASFGPRAGCDNGQCVEVLCEQIDAELHIDTFDDEPLPADVEVCLEPTACSVGRICASAAENGEVLLEIPIVVEGELVITGSGFLPLRVTGSTLGLAEQSDFALVTAALLTAAFDEELGERPDLVTRGAVLFRTEVGEIGLDAGADEIEVSFIDDEIEVLGPLYLNEDDEPDAELDLTSEVGIALFADVPAGDWLMVGEDEDPFTVCSPRFGPPGVIPETVEAGVRAGEVRLVTMNCQ